MILFFAVLLICLGAYFIVKAWAWDEFLIGVIMIGLGTAMGLIALTDKHLEPVGPPTPPAVVYGQCVCPAEAVNQ
jgi:hypothetical protein